MRGGKHLTLIHEPRVILHHEPTILLLHDLAVPELRPIFDAVPDPAGLLVAGLLERILGNSFTSLVYPGTSLPLSLGMAFCRGSCYP